MPDDVQSRMEQLQRAYEKARKARRLLQENLKQERKNRIIRLITWVILPVLVPFVIVVYIVQTFIVN